VVECHAAKELIGGRKVQKAFLLFGSFDGNRSTSPFWWKAIHLRACRRRPWFRRPHSLLAVCGSLPMSRLSSFVACLNVLVPVIHSTYGLIRPHLDWSKKIVENQSGRRLQEQQRRLPG
jgi:hypothetical protein